MKQHTNISIDTEVIKRFKTLVPNVSADIEAYMRQKIADAGGQEDNPGKTITPEDYQALRTNLERKRKQIANVEEYLRKIHKFDMLYAVAKQSGLNWATLANLEELKPKLLREWSGEKSVMNEFINYLEWVQERLVINGKLDDVRSGKIKVECAIS